MASIIFIFVLATFFAHSVSVLDKHGRHIFSSVSVVGVVYCDACSTNSFSRHSYFLPGVNVHIECTFKANGPKTTEQIKLSVNRTTDKYGTYKLELPHVDGVDCVDGSAIESVCQATLISSSSASTCDIVGLKATTDQISIKSKQDNHCIYSLNALTYKPAKINSTLCGGKDEELLNSLNSSKFFLPYFPPFPFPPFPSLPFPPLPPFPHFPFPYSSSPPSLPQFPPLPPFPFPYSSSPPPSLPFPFPPAPPFFQPPSPPAFNLSDPRTWIPHIPSVPPPPPPAFDLRDPRTWIPHTPSLPSPPPLPPPPAFDLRDPRTWIPYLPPSPPQNQNP